MVGEFRFYCYEYVGDVFGCVFGYDLKLYWCIFFVEVVLWGWDEEDFND